VRLIGIDPGLRNTGWGIIDMQGSHLRHVANGTVQSDGTATLAYRLLQLQDGLIQVFEEWQPEEAAVEETFVNSNATTTLALGMARGIALLVPAQKGLSVAQYLPNKVKKAVVGAGHAQKEQVQMMVQRLLPGVTFASADAADALAVAICHAHLRASLATWEASPSTADAVSAPLATGQARSPAQGAASTAAQRYKRALMVRS
jgi:crossover junction endodeoxyribonuclease RuvC